MTGEAAPAVLGKTVSGDEGSALIALKICWLSLLRLLRGTTKMVFGNKKKKEKLKEEGESEHFPS